VKRPPHSQFISGSLLGPNLSLHSHGLLSSFVTRCPPLERPGGHFDLEDFVSECNLSLDDLHPTRNHTPRQRFEKRMYRHNFKSGSCPPTLRHRLSISCAYMSIPKRWIFKGHSARLALTKFKLLNFYPNTGSLLYEVDLLTGRTHQIRMHFFESGFPVVGDPKYNFAETFPVKGFTLNLEGERDEDEEADSLINNVDRREEAMLVSKMGSKSSKSHILFGLQASHLRFRNPLTWTIISVQLPVPHAWSALIE